MQNLQMRLTISVLDMEYDLITNIFMYALMYIYIRNIAAMLYYYIMGNVR